jgi:hypothetical protein
VESIQLNHIFFVDMGIIGTCAATLRQETSSNESRGVMLKMNGAKLAGMAKVSPIPKGYHTITTALVVKNADEAIKFYEKAFGAKPTMPVMDAFWGDRMGGLTDSFGHNWGIATHKKNLTRKQIQKGQAEFFASMDKPQA